MRSPVLPAVLSALLPGLGQFIQGRRYRGVSILLGFLVMLATVAWYRHPVWYFSPALIWLWNIWDAIGSARGHARSLLLPVLAGLAAA